MTDHLFVYGTLRRGADHPMHRVLANHSIPTGRATCPGKLYDLGPYPAAVADGGGEWWITGELYRFQSPQPLLTLMDQYEGCARDSPPPHPYRRQETLVARESGGELTAWVYFYLLPLGRALHVPSGDYLEGIA